MILTQEMTRCWTQRTRKSWIRASWKVKNSARNQICLTSQLHFHKKHSCHDFDFDLFQRIWFDMKCSNSKAFEHYWERLKTHQWMLVTVGCCSWLRISLTDFVKFWPFTNPSPLRQQSHAWLSYYIDRAIILIELHISDPTELSLVMKHWLLMFNISSFMSNCKLRITHNILYCSAFVHETWTNSMLTSLPCTTLRCTLFPAVASVYCSLSCLHSAPE